MRASNGFDRVSTPEELHQVLAILSESAPDAWESLAADEKDADAQSWIELPLDEADAESLAELVMRKPELKN